MVPTTLACCCYLKIQATVCISVGKPYPPPRENYISPLLWYAGNYLLCIRFVCNITPLFILLFISTFPFSFLFIFFQIFRLFCLLLVFLPKQKHQPVFLQYLPFIHWFCLFCPFDIYFRFNFDFPFIFRSSSFLCKISPLFLVPIFKFLSPDGICQFCPPPPRKGGGVFLSRYRYTPVKMHGWSKDDP